MATHSSILAWKILWTDEPGRLQSMGSQRVGHNWVTEHTHTHLYLCSHYHYQNIEHLRDCHPQTFPFLIYSPSLQFCLFHHVIRMEQYSMQHCETTCFWDSSKVSHGSVLCSFLVLSITLLYRCAIIYLSIHPLKGIGLVPLLDGYDFVWAQIFISLG